MFNNGNEICLRLFICLVNVLRTLYFYSVLSEDCSTFLVPNHLKQNLHVELLTSKDSSIS